MGIGDFESSSLLIAVRVWIFRSEECGRLFSGHDVRNGCCCEFGQTAGQESYGKFFEGRQRMSICVTCESAVAEISVQQEEDEGVGDGFGGVLCQASKEAGDTAFVVVDLLNSIGEGFILGVGGVRLILAA